MIIISQEEGCRIALMYKTGKWIPCDKMNPDDILKNGFRKATKRESSVYGAKLNENIFIKET